MLRELAVQESFYPKGKKLELMLKEFFLNTKKDSCNAVICPHAGLIYSGKTAAKAITALKKRKVYIILCPNHTGIGEKISIYPEGKWINPLNEKKNKINSFLAEKLKEKLKIDFDELAHIGEHSIEVILPFLSYLNSDYEIVAIALAEYDYKKLAELGKILSELFNEKKFSLIASSDFTHFESEKKAKETDFKAIEFIKKLDSKGFHEFVTENNASICGFTGITVAIEFSKRIGLNKAELIEYTSSAAVTNDKNNVVAYAGIKFK
ncbi:MAG: AmmeMemoRadiSam system protein B [Candidatus Diapherotrites archaeon]|nr:AmmeMemoRadiSam system protein B [Candidatus Diapherotrites archaeon]